MKITDGLGNQMFQYAYAKALQIMFSQKVYLDINDINNIKNRQVRESGWIELCDQRKYQLDNFLITLPSINAEKIPQRNEVILSKNKFLRYCDELRLLPIVYIKEADCNEAGMKLKYQRYRKYYLEGSFFDKNYYGAIENILRQEYQLKNKLCIPNVIGRNLKNRNTVSVHIRRKDFLRVGRNISEGDYYKKAIAYIGQRIEKPVLFIFSDDIEWVKSQMTFDWEYILISEYGFSDCEEMILMSMCKNNIIANSTFSYWGAWLNPNIEKTVIAPRGWRQKIIPDSWVLL